MSGDVAFAPLISEGLLNQHSIISLDSRRMFA
jgi:hypothetical protein